jgi:hypothetical protein
MQNFLLDRDRLLILRLTSIASPLKIAGLFAATPQRSAWTIEKALSKVSPSSLKSPIVTLHQVTTVISTNPQGEKS